MTTPNERETVKMITMILQKSRLIDVTVTLSACGESSRRADYYQVTAVSDNGAILVSEATPALHEAFLTYSKWKGPEEIK